MENKQVRVRFAPSPTGGLHLGGVRTVLYNYLFAKANNGKFILRIEDTDQNRFVAGAEQYIFDCLNWCGLIPDESTVHGGFFGPYRQSERKEIYAKYARQLVEGGYAYYAFDTTTELEEMRDKLKAAGSNSLQYDHRSRGNMKNSLSLTKAETEELLKAQTPFVIRIKIEPGQIHSFTDLVRGEIEFNTDNVDDKVLIKADGMPTYHLAVVVDDYLMQISHAFRGEEWLPSAPVHMLLWKYLFGVEQMPHWVHLPLILKPDGNGKLSKRDGDRLGFPVYAMDWTDPNTGETSKGFKELGFLPEAFNNMLAMLGWNAGTEQEIFSLQELIDHFSLDRVHVAGAKFDFEKAKWFNHEWIKKTDASAYADSVKQVFKNNGVDIHDDQYFIQVLNMVKDRCHLLTDFYEQAIYFFAPPNTLDIDAIKPKWTKEQASFFETFAQKLETAGVTNELELEALFKGLATERNLKPGSLQMPLRIMLVGGKFGPGVFKIVETIGVQDTIGRIKNGLALLA